MLSIGQVVAQLPSNITRLLTADADEFAPLLMNLYRSNGAKPRAVLIALDDKGWSVTVDGVADAGIPGRQAGSRGRWPSMRHALLVAILLCERPELPVEGA